MMNIWHRVAEGELVDSDAGTVRYTVDWNAFREMRESSHWLMQEDDPEDVFDAMVTIRATLHRPMNELMLEVDEDDG